MNAASRAFFSDLSLDGLDLCNKLDFVFNCDFNSSTGDKDKCDDDVDDVDDVDDECATSVVERLI